jgi:hypothetical protein
MSAPFSFLVFCRERSIALDENNPHHLRSGDQHTIIKVVGVIVILQGG